MIFKAEMSWYLEPISNGRAKKYKHSYVKKKKKKISPDVGKK